MTEYDSDTIQVLSGLDAVRKRPGMYVGDTTNGSGLHHLLWEIVANVIDQHLAGCASELRVELTRDGWISVRDDGPGIPTENMPPRRYRDIDAETLQEATDDRSDARDVRDQTAAPSNSRDVRDQTAAPSNSRDVRDQTAAPSNSRDVLERRAASHDVLEQAVEPPISILEVLCTRLHAGPTWDSHWPHVHIAPSRHGVGIAAVNALSERFEVETTYRGIRWTQSFARGTRTAALRRIGPSSIEGTTVRLRPDPTIFSTIELDHVRIEARLQELAWLNPHLRVYFQEQRLHARGGIAGWARMLASERGLGIEWHSLARNIGGVGVNVAFAWNRNGAPLVRSFVNMQPTTVGTHVQGLWLGLADYARSRKARARTVEHVREALGCGLVAVLDVGMYDPRFGAPTRDQLCNPEAAKAVRAAVRDGLSFDDGRTYHLRRFLDARLHVRTP